MLTPTLETPRLILRPLNANDVQEVFECWMQDEDVARYMMWESSTDIAAAREFVNFEMTMLNSDTWYRFAIAEKGTERLLGTCLVYYSTEERCWDISYNLGKEYWGQGYATEAMHQVMMYAICIVGAKDFCAAHSVENVASQHVIEKLGFKYVKDIPYVCNGDKIHTTGKFYRLHVG